MKNCKLALLVGLLLFALSGAFATETRVKALTGDAEKGAFRVTDSWCDPFYISPSLALISDDTFFWVKDSVALSMKFGTGDYNFVRDHRAGLFYSRERFRFLFDFNFSNVFSSEERGDANNIYYSQVYGFINFHVGGNLLFAWQLADGISLGVKLGAESSVHDKKYTFMKDIRSYSSSYDSQYSDSESKYWDSLLNLTVRENIGLTIDREKVTTTFALPFTFSIEDDMLNYNYNGNFYYRYSNYTYKLALRNLTDFKIKDRALLRLNSQFEFAGSTQENSQSNKHFKTFEKGVPDKVFRAYSVGGSLSLALNHYLNSDRHLLYYGAELSTTHIYAWEGDRLFPTGPYVQDALNYLAVDGFLGGEMKPHEKVHLLFGLQIEVFRLALLNEKIIPASYNLIPEDVKSEFFTDDYFSDRSALRVYSPMSCDISFGLEINPVKGFTIELNSTMFNLSPAYKGHFTFNFAFDVGLVWNISELKRVKKEDESSFDK